MTTPEIRLVTGNHWRLACTARAARKYFEFDTLRGYPISIRTTAMPSTSQGRSDFPPYDLSLLASLAPPAATKEQMQV